MASDILYFCFVQISLLIPGYALIKKTKLLSKQPGAELSLGYFFTIVFFAALATADYALGLSPVFSRLICWLAITIGLVEFFRARYFNDLLKLRFPLLCLVGMSLLANIFLGLTYGPKYTYIPDPTPQPSANYHALNVKVINVAQTPADDNYIPYRQAQFFINRSNPAKDSFIDEWGVNFFERTPLMGAVTANYLNLFNNKPPINFLWSPGASDPDHTYQKFQILADTLNSLFIVPAFFLLKRLFSHKTAIITCLFLVTSQYFLYNAVFSWPKSLVAFFILTSWLMLLEKRPTYTLLAGIVSGFAYLTHDLAVLYIGASVVFLLINKRFREFLFFTIPVVLLAAPWSIVASLIYHRPSTFIYYPISTGGIPQTGQGKQIIHQFFNTSLLRILKIRIDNLVYWLSPYELLTSEGGQAGFRRLWAAGLFNIPGALGFGLLIPAYLAIIKSWHSKLLWIFIFIPVGLAALIMGWPKGLGALHFAEAIIVLLSGWAISYLIRLKKPLLIIGAYLLNIAQLVFFITYSYKFAVGVWFNNLRDLIYLLTLGGLVILCGWLIYKVSTDQQSPITGKV